MNYTIKNTTEQIENIGGIILAGEIFSRIGLNIQATDEIKRPEVLRAMLGLLVQARTSYEEIDIYRNSNLFRTALNLNYVPVDIDVSPMDNSRTQKDNVSRTYKGHDGFAPIFAYVGAEGYMLDSELRPGKQHCKKNTPEFFTKGHSYC